MVSLVRTALTVGLLAGPLLAQVLTVPNGGTGKTVFIQHGPLLGNGTGAISSSGPGTAGQCWVSGGPGADPAFQTCPIGGSTLTANVNGVINVQAPPYNATGNGTTDDTAAINSAISAAASAGTSVYFPAGTYLTSSCITVPSTMSYRSIYGERWASSILASASFSGTCMMQGSASLVFFTLKDILFNVNNVTGVTTAVDFSQIENSIGDTIDHLYIKGIPNNNLGLNLDGDEDTTLTDGQIFCYTSGPPGACTALEWQVPSGNINIRRLEAFTQIHLGYQIANIIQSTLGSIECVNTLCLNLSLDGDYIYNTDTSKAHFLSTTLHPFVNIAITGSYLTASQSNGVSFVGPYGGNVTATATIWDQGAQTGNTIVGATTVVSASTTPAFTITGVHLKSGVTYGTPAAGVSFQTMLVSGALSAVTPATAVNAIANGSNTQTWNWGLTGTTNGMVLGENSAGSGTGSLVRINGLSNSVLPLDVTGIDSVSQTHFGPPNNGGWLTGFASGAATISGGANTLAAGSIAKNTSAAVLSVNSPVVPGGYVFYGNTGLTVGNTITWVQLASLDNTGNFKTTKLTVTGGVTKSSGMQHARITSCAIPATANGTCDSTLTWTTTFVDLNYTVACTSSYTGGAVAFVTYTRNKTTANTLVTAMNVPGSTTGGTLELDCMAMHD